ncbi:caspase family protein [Rhodoplanes azumiensis]|uniref:Caspase family protein n=1 Tax=Rhodoplanes azumiensis TaxID=1897628 RepID=A0ABW5AMV8_9BRAD
MLGRLLVTIARRVVTTAVSRIVPRQRIASALWIAVLGLAVPIADPALADRRVALVIGNSAYENVGKLDNPHNDAAAIAEMFRKAKFDLVELKRDLGVIEFKRALRDFYNTTRDADVAVVYYAGHGIEVGGVNYMVPVDAKLRSDYDAEDEAVALERIFRSIESTRRLRLVILDACRDNPFIRGMQRQIATRAVSQGLAKIEPMGTDTLVAYAAKAGSTAEDGAGRNSPFTQALVNNLTTPGLDIRIALGRVRDEVLKRTNNRQEPFVYGSLGGATVSLVPEPERAATTDPRGDYELAERVATVSAWDAFLAVHGTGFYAELARQQRAKLAAAAKPDAMAVAALDRATPSRPAEDPDRTSPDRLAWEKLQDTSDPAAIRAFIKKFPASPLAVVAQSRLEVIERAIADRKREEAEKQRQEAERQREAARLREEEERRAKAAAAEEARRAKAAAEAEARAQREAARRREEDARIARLAEAERAKAEREAAQRRAEEERQAKAAAEAERQRQEREAARLRDEEEKRAKAAAEAAQKAQREAALRLEQEKERTRERSQEEIIRSAQIELRRIGCYEGDDNGVFNDATRRAMLAYRLGTAQRRSDAAPDAVDLLELQAQRPIKACLAALDPQKGIDKPAEKPPVAERPSRDKKETTTRREKPEPKREREARPAPRREPAPARAQATARPAPRAGGAAVMHGIGF